MKRLTVVIMDDLKILDGGLGHAAVKVEHVTLCVCNTGETNWRQLPNQGGKIYRHKKLIRTQGPTTHCDSACALALPTLVPHRRFVVQLQQVLHVLAFPPLGQPVVVLKHKAKLCEQF